MDVRRVPPYELRHAFGRAEEAGGPLDVAMHHAASGEGRARCHGSNDQGRTKSCPWSTNYSSQTPLASVGLEMFAQVGVSRMTQDQRALDSAQHITLLSAMVGGERGSGGRRDRVGLVLPLSPGRGLREVRAWSLTYARSLSVAKHVDEVQISRHKQLMGAVRKHGFGGAVPVAQSFAGAGWTDALLVHA